MSHSAPRVSCYAYLSYQSIDSKGSVKKSAALPFPDATYDAFDRLRYDMGDPDRPADFDAALADLEALYASTGQTQPDNYLALRGALNSHNRASAIYLENQLVDRFKRLCDTMGTAVTKLHLMRVGAGGSSSDVVVKEWNASDSTIYTVSSTYPFYRETSTQTGPADVRFGGAGSNIITNADHGALYSWNVSKTCYENSPADPTRPWRQFTQTDPTCLSGIGEEHLTVTAGGSIASDVVWDPGVPDAYEPVAPSLQLEDGSFAGTVNAFSGETLLVFDASGAIKWTLPDHYPVMVTPGGLVASGGSGTYLFDATGNATTQIASVPTYSWKKHSYAEAQTGITQTVARDDVKWGTSYAAMLQGNPSATGTAVAVIEASQPLPSYGLSAWGGNCSLGSNKPPLAGPVLNLWNTQRTTLIQSGYLTSALCTSFFSDPARAPFANQLTAGVQRQELYDGPSTTISRFDAGMMNPLAFLTPAVEVYQSAMKKMPVCGEFVPSIARNGRDVIYSVAASQAMPSVMGPNPPKDVYVNTDPFVATFLTPGTVLHEALHNLTTFDDPALEVFVGPLLVPEQGNPITVKLLQVHCAPR